MRIVLPHGRIHRVNARCCGLIFQHLNMTKNSANTCADYREEMILLSLRRRLEDPGVSEEEKPAIRARVRELENTLDMQ
jgi:hypothetical protein